MPDDFIHYAQPRSPTLRECARLQTFLTIISSQVSGLQEELGELGCLLKIIILESYQSLLK